MTRLAHLLASFPLLAPCAALAVYFLIRELL